MNTTRQKVLSSLATLVIFLVPTVSVQTPAKAQDATILLYSDPRPGQSADGETALTEDFNQADDQIPSGWTLDCVQNSGDIDDISTSQLPNWTTLDNAYSASELATLPHFMCVGNHEAEDTQVMTDIRAKYSSYPDWNLISGPFGTSETTYSYDIGDIHVIVINEYWNGVDNDACLIETCIYEDINTPFDGGYIVNELFEWIKEDLRSSTKPYKIIVGHESGYPVDRHVGNSLDANSKNRDKFFNLLITERVIAYFSSHSHNYDLTEHDGVFEVNTGVCGSHVGTVPNPGVGDNDNFATLVYAHCDGDGFKIRTVGEDPLAGWFSPNITTVTRSEFETQVLVNTAGGAGTVCRYFVDYTESVEPNPDWSAYGAWWENGFDDVEAEGWLDGELAVGYDSTHPDTWEWINQTIDPDSTSNGDEQVYGVFARIPFTVYDRNAYPYMKLGVDYDDAVTVWLNGIKIYESPTSPSISSTDYWNKVATGGHEANGYESLNPIFETFDVSDYKSSLNDGDNLLVIGNWNRQPNSSDLITGIKLYLTKNLVSAGATWRYNDTGTDLGIRWRYASYDDSDWPYGPAELGYGDGDEATVIEYGPDQDNKHPCYYFRHSFNVSDTSDYGCLLEWSGGIQNKYAIWGN